MVETLTPKQKSAIERVKQKPELLPLLFRKATGLQWFNAFKDAGFLVPTEVPQPVPAKEEGYVNIPIWPITDYLVASSVQLLDPDNERYAVEVLDFIRAATNHAKQQNFGNYRVWWQFSKIIQNIPPNLIREDDLELLDYWLDDKYERGLVADSLGQNFMVSLLDRRDKHCNALALGLLQVLYKVNLIAKRNSGDMERKEAVLRFDSWHANKITKNVAARGGQELGQPVVEIFRTRLEYVLISLDNDKWSSIWRSAIEDHDQNHSTDDAEDILVIGMRDALLAYVGDAPDSVVKAYVGELLESPFETTRRIAIYIIDQKYQQFREFTDRVIVEQHVTSNFRHEVWHLLHNHYTKFSEQEKTRVQELIARLVEQDKNGQYSKGATAYTHSIWLTAIKDYSEDAAIRYRECVDTIGGEPEHPDFSNYMSSGVVEHKSPITKDEILSMEVEELVRRLDLYEAPVQFGEPGLEGLVKALRQAVKSEPIRFSNYLHMFSNLDLAFVYEFLEGYGELWTEKSQLPWGEIWGHLLAFCKEVIDQDKFWSDENAKSRRYFVANRYWIVGGIGRLIENGTRSDEHAFPEKYLEQAGGILQVLLEKEEGGEFRLDGDAVSIAINSPRGRCLEAYINFTLRTCRLADKNNGDHVDAWAMFQQTYNSELARADTGEYEFATLVVNYLPNFLYMSKDWVMGKLNDIFDHENYQKWLCAMSGYAYVSRVYEGVYAHLKVNGHFIRALDDDNLKELVVEKIIQNIAVGYLNNDESIEDDSSLICQLLIRGKYRELSHLIWFLWTLRKNGDQKTREKIFELWPRLLDCIDISSREGKKLSSKLCDWSAYIDVIDESNKKLILVVAPFADYEFNSHELQESIARISENQPKEAIEIWLRLLENTCPDFLEEAIRTALTNLVTAGQEGIRDAKKIVSIYLREGNERPSAWLHEITGGTL